MKVSTSKSLPVAHAGDDQTVPLHTTVRLNGSASSDLDGDLLTYEWTLLSAPPRSAAGLLGPSTVNPSFVVDLPGDYVVQIVVRNAFGRSRPDVVRISTSNSLPVAHAGPDQTVAVRTAVQLDGRASSDIDGDPLTYDWTLVSAPAGSTARLLDATTVNPSFVVDLPGDYGVQLVVRDPFGSSRPHVVRISTTNSAPVAEAGPDQTVTPGTSVRLDGSASSDIDGDPLTYHWTLLATPSRSAATLLDPTSVNPSFVPDVPGTYVVQLIVNDGTVDSHPDTVSVSAAVRSRLDLDIKKLDVPKQTAPGHPILIVLEVKNQCAVDEPRLATITATRNGVVVYAQRATIRGAAAGVVTCLAFPPYVPTTPGTLRWTATITHDHRDRDTVEAVTKVRRNGKDPES